MGRLVLQCHLQTSIRIRAPRCGTWRSYSRNIRSFRASRSNVSRFFAHCLDPAADSLATLTGCVVAPRGQTESPLLASSAISGCWINGPESPATQSLFLQISPWNACVTGLLPATTIGQRKTLTAPEIWHRCRAGVYDSNAAAEFRCTRHIQRNRANDNSPTTVVQCDCVSSGISSCWQHDFDEIGHSIAAIRNFREITWH